MEQVLLIFTFIYGIFSLLASAIYYNSNTHHSKSQKVINHLLIWVIPFIWAFYLKKKTPIENELPIRNDITAYSNWKIWEDQHDIYFAESGFESMYDRMEIE